MPVTASHEEHHPGGNDEVAETQQALLGLRSGVTDPADDSSVAFYRFEYVLTKATRPYRLHEVESDEDLHLWEAVHYWKLGILRATILPFKDLALNIFRAADFEDSTMFEQVVRHIYGGDVPKAIRDNYLCSNLVEVERQRVICRIRQGRMGKLGEKQDRQRNRDWIEDPKDVKEAEKFCGFLDHNESAFDLRGEVLDNPGRAG
ncbi:MAG: hypothetical protein LQ349_004605 [Xanthoria aureola]|nr:MAG: hypothetical protein LQ349_004605 [Xanthoria aureola]